MENKDKTVLITGATGAIGGVAAIEIARLGAKVVLLGRDKKKLESFRKTIISETSNQNIEILDCDLSDILSIKKAVATFKQSHQKLDVLVNVAAVFRSKRETTKQGLEMMFGTNHIGVFKLTNELLDLLKASHPSRIISVTAPSSTKIKFDDLQGEKKFSAFHSFGASKIANHFFTYALANKMEGKDVTAMAFHPGLVKSDLVAQMPAIVRLLFPVIANKPEKAGKALAQLALAPEYEKANGKFFDYKLKELSKPGHSNNEPEQERLWNLSETMVNRVG